ncbi:E3 ubiquitin-protein ligase E3D [Clupea harengus]|uniref:E3 ubiquitin-protein ligase E3D n=1 Tax=Clupea harengus TaxID=7950 RepID=A0A8M1KRV4_CLUHA|nr:E3 ubiquitin-protein ligase E3D [Clupea harengus]
MEETGKQQHEIFLELRQRLESGLLILRKDVAHSPTEVKVFGSDSSLLIQTSRGLWRAELPPRVSVVPGSCQPTPTGDAGEGLHFRLRLRVDQQTESRGSVIERIQVQQSYGFCCQACGSRILEQRVFQRVLPLPGGNWNTLVGEWCCHPDPFANRKLLPRTEDCLTGDTYFLLARDNSCNQTLTVEPNPTSARSAANHSQDSEKPRHVHRTTVKEVSCKNCSSMLGEALTGDALKFYITEVMEIESEDCETKRAGNRLEFVEKTLSARHKNIFVSGFLNTDTLVGLVSRESGNRQRHTHLFLVTVAVPTSINHARSQCSQSPLPPLQFHIHQDIVSAWERDISVHNLTLPHTTCQEVLQLLSASTSCLPPSLRCMNSYQVAFMRR